MAVVYLLAMVCIGWRDTDIDEVDIEYRYCNVDRLLPNLYNDIKQGVEQIIQMKNSNV